MLKVEIAKGSSGRIILMDSITQLTAADEGAIVIAASHGGVSSGELALRVPLRAVAFNDAGVGKDDAGIAALAMLETRHVAAITTSHVTGRIGDVEDMWKSGVISHVNGPAQELGFSTGDSLQRAVFRLIGA